MGKSTEPLKTRQYVTAETLTRLRNPVVNGAARKLLIITALGIFRVVKIPTLKMPKSLLLSGLQVALAGAVLWRWQAEQRHGPRRIAKHLELSGLLPLPAGRHSKIESK